VSTVPDPPPTAEELTDTAERAWRWVLDQVRTDGVGPWIPGQVTGTDADETAPNYRDGMHSGIAGLAHVLSEIRLDRDWTHEESALAEVIGARLRDRVQTEASYDYFDGLASDIGAFVALGQEGTAAAVDRLAALAEPDGWPQNITEPPRFLPDARISDATLGTASVALGALWADRHGVAGAGAVLERAADILLAEAEHAEGGLRWRFVPMRFRTDPATEMPNWSHGQAGILAAVALAGHRLDRGDLVDAARRGGEHLVRLGDLTGDRFAVPHFLFPPDSEATSDEDEYAWGWCHGPTGTSLAFAALALAGVESVAGDAPSVWQRRCLEAVRRSGIPERKHPGFWDNDGRCCGTAGVGSVFLDSYGRFHDPADLDFALTLAAAVLQRAEGTEDRVWWRFVEHRNADPMLPPGVGWMQGAAGIAAFLFQAARAVRDGREAAAVTRMESWWAGEAAS
jgi:hypothetical protein